MWTKKRLRHKCRVCRTYFYTTHTRTVCCSDECRKVRWLAQMVEANVKYHRTSSRWKKYKKEWYEKNKK